MSWEIKKLSELVSEVSIRNRCENIPVYSVTNTLGFTPSDEYFKKQVFSKNLSNYKIVKKGNFAYNPSRINVGSIDFLSGIDEVLISPLYVVFECCAALDQSYLKYFLKSEQGISQVNSATSGSVRDSLKFSALTRLEIPIPPLPIQKRIAEILDAADALKRKDQELLKKYDELAQAIFIDMFGDPVKNEKGWEVKTLGDIFGSFKYGINQKSNDNTDGIPVLRIPNVIGNEIDLSNLKYSILELKEIESTKLEIGDLLFVRSNGNPNYIGRSALFLNQGRYSYASYLIRARLKSPNVTLANFIQYVLSYKTYRPIILKKATTTAGNYNINTESLKSLSIPIPKQELMDSFFEKMKLNNALNKSINSHKNSDNLFDSLIQKAFKGELVTE